MTNQVIGQLATLIRHSPATAPLYATEARGLAVLNSPLLNKGSAFSIEERKALGLTGLLPPEISTLAMQVQRAYLQYERLPDALSKNVYLTALHDRNEVLFYRLFAEHLREMIPIVNDLTVGMAMVQYHHECRPPRGVYLSINHPDDIEEAFLNLGVGAEDIDLILATDAEQIPGIGDWGVGGIEVSIGKLAIYTAAGGINPNRSIPVMLDVGTNRQSLLEDPMYIGNRHPRIRGDRYDDFIESYVRTVTRLFPHALLQWEDFAPRNSRRLLELYRSRTRMFNEDMQGTGAVTLAAIISASRIRGTPLRKDRIVILGAGTAGVGIADRICEAMVQEGLSPRDAYSRIWCVDRQGLLLDDNPIAPEEHQKNYVRSAREVKGWRRSSDGSRVELAEVMRKVSPTILVGASASPRAFSEAIVREMASHCSHPIIFVLSQPAARAEASASDLINWTDGRGLVATGLPSAPVTLRGVTHVIAQVNNAMLYPGLALGVIVSGASRINNQMLDAASRALSSLVAVNQPGASLLPHVDDLRSVSCAVAEAVAGAAIAGGLSTTKLAPSSSAVQDAMWKPEYIRVEAC